MLKLQSSIKAVFIKSLDSPIHMFLDIICWWDIYIMYSTIIIIFLISLGSPEFYLHMNIVYGLILCEICHIMGYCSFIQLYILSISARGINSFICL